MIVSHLVECGHADAPDYPIAFAFDEYQIVVDRENARAATQGVVLQAAVSTGVAAFGKDGGRKAAKQFSDLIKKLAGDDSVRHESSQDNTDDLKTRRSRHGTERH